MQELTEQQNSAFFRRFSLGLSGLSGKARYAFLLALMKLFPGAEAQVQQQCGNALALASEQCSNALGFPYQLGGDTASVGTCISLAVPSNVTGTSIPIMLSFAKEFRNITEQLLENCPNVTVFLPDDICFSQLYVELKHLSNSFVKYWGLQDMVEMGYSMADNASACLKGQVPNIAIRSSGLVAATVITSVIGAVMFAGFLFALYKFMSRANSNQQQADVTSAEAGESLPLKGVTN